MEHFPNPFDEKELSSVALRHNQLFFAEVCRRAKKHRFFSHPFLAELGGVTRSAEAASFILTSFYQVVAPFTGLLCSLAGRAPNLRTRFLLLDNIYEEMGCGELAAAHPNLYLKMLASIGVSQQVAESGPVLPSIARINEHLRSVVERGHFSVACAVLASAESVIPPSFPVLEAIARAAFPHVDTTFFERHGSRDEGHAGDASLLFAVTGSESRFVAVEREVMLDLDYRSELHDAWMSCLSHSSEQSALVCL